MKRKGRQPILVTGARAPVALHIARLLHGAGFPVVLADSLRHTLGSVSACADHALLPPAADAFEAYADAVTHLVSARDIALVIPTCEEVFHLARVWQVRRPGATLFAPPLDMLARAHDKFAFFRHAQSLGLAVPPTTQLQSRDDLEAVRHDSANRVFKPVWSRFATHALIRPDPEKLTITPSRSYPWVTQDHVEGEELSAHAFAHDGHLAGLCTYRPLWRAGRGAGVCFARDDDRAVQAWVEKFAAATGWTGQLSFDFIRKADGTVVAIECNPRATSGVHFFADPAAFSDALLGTGPRVFPDVAAPQTLPLAMWVYGLPQAVKTGRIGQFRNDLRAAGNILTWPGDGRPARQAPRALLEIARIALRDHVSLQAASTRDIEWNGPVSDN